MFVVRRSRALVRMFNSSKKGIEDLLKERGNSEEGIYFKRKDKEILKTIIDKLEKSIQEESDPDVIKKNRDNLVEIIKKHNLQPTEDFVDEIMDWRVDH